MAILQTLLSDEIAGIGTLGIGLAVVSWKLWLRYRRDTRDDRTGEAAQTGYSMLLDELQETVERQGRQIVSLGEKLDDEIAKRWAVQEENAQLRLRIIHLEHEVRRLGGTVTPIERNQPP